MHQAAGLTLSYRWGLALETSEQLDLAGVIQIVRGDATDGERRRVAAGDAPAQGAG